MTVEDVREMAPYVLYHRLIVSGEMTPQEALRIALEQVPAPERVTTYHY